MTSLTVARTFLSHVGFSRDQSRNLMIELHNDMSRLMLCSHRDLRRINLARDSRLRLLRAIRCFHREKWSKYLHNYFSNGSSFERFVYHLLKYHIWIIYASWTLEYLRKFLVIIPRDNLRFFYEKLHRLQTTIQQIKQLIITMKQTI